MPKVDDCIFKMPAYPSVQSRDREGAGPGREIGRCGGIRLLTRAALNVAVQ